MAIVCLVFLLAGLIPLTCCENCEPITVASCLDAGYRLTARFYDIDEEPYQDVQAEYLDVYVPLLQVCSKYASTIMCSLYVPKCEEGRDVVHPPCRKVCTQFVSECRSLLITTGLLGSLTALCDLLPDEPQSSDSCFYPSNFTSTSSEAFPTDTCYDVVEKKCKENLHYTKTFVPTRFQNDEKTIFESVVHSNCSSKLETFFCYAQFPPCNASAPNMAFLPCKSMCDEIGKDCWRELSDSGYKLPDCNFIYPKEENSNGLCELKKWPAPWPKEFRPPAPPIGTCEELTVKSCKNAGYKLTAKYLPVHGVPFQQIKANMLDTYLPLLQECSPYSSLILCSLFLPKCVPGSSRPMLPCRQVCFEFAEHCKAELRLASTAGLLVAMCDLLPVYDGDPNKCIWPDGFKTSLSSGFTSRNVCHKVTSASTCANDLHYNSTFLPSEDQIKSDFSILDAVINSKCSPDIEKYLCFSRLPPCTADTTMVHLPCKGFCERITYDCLHVFEANYIPPLHCNFTFPKGNSKDGLCHLKRWPAPWPWKIPDPVLPTSAGKTKCIPLTVKVCTDAGYDLTADFPPPEHDGPSYQEAKGKNLEFFLQFLKICSPYSSAVMCSLHMPKCVEGVDRPIPPCRSVCLEFVHQCKSLLGLASHHGLFRALCDLLPEQDLWPNTCFVPDGFKPSSASVTPRDDCKKVVSPKYCSTNLHYDKTFVSEADQTGITYPLQKVVSSGCSPELEKYLCYTSVPPCKTNDLSVYVPCKDVCEQVKRDCGSEFLKVNIPLPDCSWVYPDKSHPTGLCRLTKFPAPWPYKVVEDQRPATVQRTRKQGGVIAAVVVVLGIVALAVIIGVLYYRYRQAQMQFAAKRFDNVDFAKDDSKA